MSTTFALESIADRRPLKQTKEDYISAWLSQQSLHDDIDYDQEPIWEEPREDTNQIQDMSAIQLDAIGPTQHHHQHQSVAYDHLYLQPQPHLPYFDLLQCDQGHDHRRSLSLANLDKTTYSMWQQQEYAEHSYYQHEQQQQYYDQLHYHTIHGYPFQSQEYSSHRYPLHDQSASMYASPHCTASQWTYAASSPKRTADELAWDRHYYYQRLQLEEDERAERLRRQQLRHQRRQALSKQPQPNSVTRTGSLNRLASPSLLSVETSRVLGLCRSNTLTAAVKRMSLAKKETFVVSRHTSPSPGAKNTRVPAMDQQEKETSRDVVIPASAVSLPLTHKKTLRDHLPTSLRTLARRCSSRLSNGRPKSFAGSRPDPEVEYSLTRRSMGSRPMHSSVGGHMCDFKPLQAGPETTESQKQSSQRKAILRNSLSEPVPVHRTVALFRSSTMRLSTSSSLKMGDNEDAQSAEAAKMLARRKSMRFANGRGLDFTTKICVDPQVEDKHGLNTQDRSEQGQPVLLETLTSVSDAIPDLDTQESMRKEIVSILSRGRKNRQRRQSARSKSPTPLASATSSVQRLSPLAVEAQEDLPCDESEDDDDDEEDKDDTAIEFEKKLMDTCEHIAFMLVPKSRYEFQPLVAL
ncbi:hypothetical protein BG011_001787 [Mortierella polycephala]|uniref:Uncharacterized protein n=1 Tax=Mortierella polycephala TaxID=41804 RepID=A0A9P6QE31_9FUNG|nr:hypothetical protein BG011_001787 [Mortierella polycephala]